MLTLIGIVVLVTLATIAVVTAAPDAPAADPPPPPSCIGDCVPRSELVAAQKLAAKRLRGWNHANRIIIGLRSSLRVQVRLGASGLERAFLCIHRFEGSWVDPNAPFYGGLQMDGSFQRTYGGTFLRAFGPANNWTPSMQLAVAEIAYLSGRGFYPWPNTARYCGLL